MYFWLDIHHTKFPIFLGTDRLSLAHTCTYQDKKVQVLYMEQFKDSSW